jgi:hypothetical protein
VQVVELVQALVACVVVLDKVCLIRTLVALVLVVLAV